MPHFLYTFDIFINSQVDFLPFTKTDFESFCKNFLYELKFSINFTDLTENPEAAFKHQIIATPLVIIGTRSGQKRFVGSLRDLGPVLKSIYATERAFGQMGDAKAKKERAKELRNQARETFEEWKRSEKDPT